MKIFLMRHGKTEFNKQELVQGSVNSVLSEDGKIQAQKLSEIVKDLDIKVIYTGTLKRQIETADIIGESLNIKNRKELANFNEANFGTNEKHLISDVFKQINDKLNKQIKDFNDGSPIEICDSLKMLDTSSKAESGIEVSSRFKEGLDLVLKENKENVLIISSGMAIGCLIESLCPEFKEYSVLNCSVHSLEYKDGKYYAESIFKGIKNE